MRNKPLIFLFMLSSCLPGTLSAQTPWSGVISPSRAINWSGAGVVGGVPTRSTQCGSTIAAYGSSSAPASPSTINSAIAACTPGEFVQLGSGTFYISGGIDFTGHNNVTLRGMGANSTFIEFSSSDAKCGGPDASVCLSSANNSPEFEGTVCDWTSGYSQGTTTITIANCGSTTPAKGSISNLVVGGIMVLDQVDSANDTGQIWMCDQPAASVGALTATCEQEGNGGDARNNGVSASGSSTYCASLSGGQSSGNCDRDQQQIVQVTQCDSVTTPGHVCSSGTNITISPGLYMPNWASGQHPQAWFNTNAVGNSLENLSIDDGGTNISSSNITIGNCYGCWISGIRSLNGNRAHIVTSWSSHFTVQNSYFYENLSHAAESYGMEIRGGSDGLVINNIFQQTTDTSPTVACSGCVIAYNYDIFEAYQQGTGSYDWFQATFYQHDGGDSFNLFEGNYGTGYTGDIIHGTHHFTTLYRNFLPGWQQACGVGPTIVNVSGTSVTWVSGGQFVTGSAWNGIPIVINGTSYSISSVNSATSLTLSASAGTLTNTYMYAACSNQTVALGLMGGSRYFNVIANVIGTPGYHSQYQCSVLTTSTSNCANATKSIYSLGYTIYVGVNDSSTNGYCTSPSCTATSYYDPQTPAYLMRWGNWDSVNAATQWNSSEVPSSVSPYGNPVPTTSCTSSASCPASLFLSSQPSWWGSSPWPAIGPDVSGGNIGQCSGGAHGMVPAISGQCTGGTFSATAYAGHANSIPAMNCAINVMGMPPDGSGGVLTFNASNCYGASSGSTGGTVQSMTAFGATPR